MKTNERAGGSTRSNSGCGKAAAGNFIPPEVCAGSAENPVLTIVLPDFRPPSLNELLKKHWTHLQKYKSRCAKLMRRVESSLRAATEQQARLTMIILWEGSKPCGTRSPKKSCTADPTPKRTGSNGFTGRSRGTGAKWKFFKNKYRRNR